MKNVISSDNEKSCLAMQVLHLALLTRYLVIVRDDIWNRWRLLTPSTQTAFGLGLLQLHQICNLPFFAAKPDNRRRF